MLKDCLKKRIKESKKNSKKFEKILKIKKRILNILIFLEK